MSSNLEQAVSALGAHRDQLAAEVAADTAALKIKQDELKKIEVALKGLGASPSKTKAAKSKRSADKEATLAAAIAVLSENAPQAIPGDDLKALTQERLREQGFSLVGVFKYWDKSLAAAEQIMETEPGIYGLDQTVVSEVA